MEQVNMIGIDLAKNSFQLHGAGADGRGRPFHRIRRWCPPAASGVRSDDRCAKGVCGPLASLCICTFDTYCRSIHHLNRTGNIGVGRKGRNNVEVCAHHRLLLPWYASQCNGWCCRAWHKHFSG